MNGLDRDDVMSLSIILHYLLVCLLQLGATDALKWIADVSGKCARTIREWRATFIANKGSFPDTLQGRYQRTGVLWHNEELNKLASRYVRENRVVKGKPNLNLQSFTAWVNTVLLPNHALDPGFPRKISCETARKWLHELGFSVTDAKLTWMATSGQEDGSVRIPQPGECPNSRSQTGTTCLSVLPVWRILKAESEVYAGKQVAIYPPYYQ